MSSGSGLFIARDLSFVRTAQADHPKQIIALRVDKNINFAANKADGGIPFFTMSIGRDDDCGLPIEFGGQGKGDASFPYVSFVLGRIELNSHNVLYLQPGKWSISEGRIQGMASLPRVG
jgi:hypothetical protein